MPNTQKTSAMESSILSRLDLTSGASWLACGPVAQQEAFLASLSDAEIRALPYLFEFWAGEHQLPPLGDWRTWVILGGRGAGKTRAGAEWVRAMVEGRGPRHRGRAQRMAIVGETYDQAREVMVFGESGILACSPPDRRPSWNAGRRQLHWPNGAVAQVLSAHDPEGLRGYQFDALWADELAKWKMAQDSWDMLQFGLRLGTDPRACVTTTPRNVAVLRDLLARSSTVQTHAPTAANAAWLADGFMEEVMARYGGTRLGRQELEGIMLGDAEGALWQSEALARSQVRKLPDLSRIVVAVDPPVTAGKGADECGIVVAGVVAEGAPSTWRGYVLADESLRGSPLEWAQAVARAAEAYGADRVVAEVNQGGDLVEELLRQVAPYLPYRAVRASRGKVARAEPVAALYEQGRVWHATGLGTLEDQMCQMTAHGFEGQGSPDRVDALVWALHELMIAPAAQWRAPRVRVL